MQGIFKSSYVGKKAVSSYVNLTGLRENRYELMEIYLLVHKDSRAVNSDMDLATILYTREMSTALTLASRGYITL
jgi:hypothetical protein